MIGIFQRLWCNFILWLSTCNILRKLSKLPFLQIVPWTLLAPPLRAAGWEILCRSGLRVQTWNKQRRSQSESHMQRQGVQEESDHSHCDIAGPSDYHRVWYQGYAGSLQDRGVLVLIFVDGIEVSHLWLLSGWKWLSAALLTTSASLLAGPHSTSAEDDRCWKFETTTKYLAIIDIQAWTA